MGSDVKTIKRIKCVLTDSDGVLTDGGMYYSENGDELKKFNTKDGMGFKLLKEAGIITGIITGENIELVRRRAEKMKVDEVYLGIQDKMKILNEICSKYDLNYEEIAYIGDDINDLEVIKTVGLGCTVHDGMKCVKDIANVITKAKGGEGAVREIVEMILEKMK
jgi:N-acylneuraminate cytidylyltransferase